ncbi:restriction endonuclease subunit S, partial [Gallibacterium anatis]|uniref:restriction endonuclease subunit S n=1 Tax=Gallibacterium anatis TaxID=750 RepID=UPI0039FCAEF3
MSEWNIKKLSEVADIIGGGTPSSKENAYYENGTIAWLTPKDLSNHKEMYISKGERNITQLGLKNSSAKLLPKGAVLFSSRAPIGYVAIAKNTLSTNQGFKSLILKSGHIPEFYYYLLKNNISLFEARASGSTFKEVSGQVVKDTELKIPDTETQRNIVKILKPLDDKITLNTQTNQTLEQIAQAIFKHWFIDFAPVHAKANALASGASPEQAELATMASLSGKTLAEITALQHTAPEAYHQLQQTAQAFPSEFVESEMGLVPKGWEVKKVKDIAKFIKGKKPKNLSENQQEGLLPYITMATLSGKNISFASPEGMIIADKLDILISMDGSAGNITIGYKGIVGSTFAKINLTGRKYISFFYQFMKNKEEDIKANTTGTSVPHTDKERVLNYSIT